MIQWTHKMLNNHVHLSGGVDDAPDAGDIQTDTTCSQMTNL